VTGSTSPTVLKGVRNVDFQLVFFTPEAILNHKRWRNILLTEIYALRLRVVVIDEAHTVVKW